MTLYSRKHNNNLTKFAKNLRKNMTDEERRLWFCFLRDYPVRFLRQKVIDGYIADFYCSKAKLIIEIDGSQHFDDENIESDAQRTGQFELRDLKVIRFTNLDINTNFKGVCEYIDNIVQQRISL